MPRSLQSAACLAIGDELVAGAHCDLNSPFLARRLTEVGRRVERMVCVGDDEQAIAQALVELCASHRLVLASGGIGPTLDDLTRRAAARAAGVALVRSEAALSELREWFERAGRKMAASNERQAWIPEGASLLPNARGTAPGFRLTVGEATLFVLPGPPNELAAMFDAVVLPWLVSHPVQGAAYEVRHFHLFDLSESVFADRAGEWMARDANPLMGVTVEGGVLSVRLITGADSATRAASLAEARAEAFLGRFGEHVFSQETPDLALVLGRLLLDRDVSVACAESCTGGMVAARITSVAGISAVFREGFVTYSNAAKRARLGVPADVLEAHGAVSAEVAAAMALGAAERSGARLAVSVTGILGPGGGSPERPVGLVWFGVTLDGEVRTVRRRWPDVGRDKVREWATTKALSLLLKAAGG